jgi:hypothetical protein
MSLLPELERYLKKTILLPPLYIIYTIKPSGGIFCLMEPTIGIHSDSGIKAGCLYREAGQPELLKR